MSEYVVLKQHYGDKQYHAGEMRTVTDKTSAARLLKLGLIGESVGAPAETPEAPAETPEAPAETPEAPAAPKTANKAQPTPKNKAEA